MDLILISIWLLMAFVSLISLIGSTYFAYVREAQPFDRAAKLIVALIVYGLLTVGSGFVVGLMVFIGGHTEPKGSVLGYREIIIGGVFLVVHAVVGWLLCSFIVGRLIRPAGLLAALHQRK